MGSDLEITLDATGELMVAQVEGVTDAGVEFVDAYVVEEMVVVDVGRIVVPESALAELCTAASGRGLNVVVPLGRASS